MKEPIRLVNAQREVLEMRRLQRFAQLEPSCRAEEYVMFVQFAEDSQSRRSKTNLAVRCRIIMVCTVTVQYPFNAYGAA